MISVSELQRRRAEYMQQMTTNGIAIFPGAKEVIRSRDTHFPFRQDSDFYYLCGIQEPDALLVLLPQGPVREVLFVLPRDAHAEVWHGRRLGCEQAKALSGVEACYPLDELEQRLPDLVNGTEHLYFAFDTHPQCEAQVRDVIRALRAAPKRSKTAPSHWHDSRPLVHQQRKIKSSDEIACMQQAADITVQAHIRAMQLTAPGVFEYQVAAALCHEFVHRGAVGPAYGSIVGGGANACILHYTQNSDVLRDGDLLLIDAGAEFAGYAADITRTFPVNGRFNKIQRQIYSIVLTAQEAAFEMIKPGNTLPQAQDACIRVLTEGLLEIGLLRGNLEAHLEALTVRKYFIHGLGHWLGLDVHDVGLYEEHGKPIPLSAGMVLTVEPGLYFAPDDESVPAIYRGMGIRIEDDLLVTEQGYRNLTAGVPKSIEQIEAIMAAAANKRRIDADQQITEVAYATG